MTPDHQPFGKVPNRLLNTSDPGVIISCSVENTHQERFRPSEPPSIIAVAASIAGAE
jgi:uncharacterized OB-fold protein